MVRRHAFTLIELIFAIVLVAIIVLSVPMMNLINAKATEGSIAQEAIFASSAKLMQTLSYPWDENSTDIEQILEGATVLSGVVKIPFGTASLDFNNTVCRPGLIARRCRIDQNGSEVNVSNLGDDNVNVLIRGLDDSNGTSNLAAGSEAYKNQYRVVTSIAYVNDNVNSIGGLIDYNASNPFANSFIFSNTSVVGPTNLRVVTVTTEEFKNGGWAPVTVLRAYGANIGEIKPYKRTY